MLYELYVENFALIRKMRLSFSLGMTALTGETGAGKSLIIDAVSLLIGGRGNDGFIRSGQDRCIIEGVFLPPYPKPVVDILSKHGVETEDSLILSRELIRGGRGLARINGRVAPISRLREIGCQLVNIHGQHEHTSLLEETRQLYLLDGFGGPDLASIASNTAKTYRTLQLAKQQVADYEENQEQRKNRIEQLTYIVDEIGLASPVPGEDIRLEEESHLLAYGEKLFQFASTVYEQLHGSGGIAEQLDTAYGDLCKAANLDKSLTELSERLHSLYYEADDIGGELASYRDRISLDPYRLDQVEERISLLNRLKKKYGGSLESVVENYTNAKAELSYLEEINTSGEIYRAELEKAEQAYATTAAALTQARLEAAQTLGKAITHELRQMAMAHAIFSVELVPGEPSIHGNERAVFMIQPNLGEAPQPVSRIASGGELSRILLGIKAVLAQLDGVPVLIFDEIDTGLSGRALVAVAERLSLVGKSAQTLAVSHAPVMAAAADNQILIEKHEEDGRTVMEAHILDTGQRVEEIARMIAGDIVTQASHQQALDLLKQMHPDG